MLNLKLKKSWTYARVCLRCVSIKCLSGSARAREYLDSNYQIELKPLNSRSRVVAQIVQEFYVLNVA